MKCGMNKTYESGVVSGVELKNGPTGRLDSVLVVTYLLVILALASTAQADEMAPGSTFRDCEQCPEMVVIPAGNFIMGDLSGKGFRDERPLHDVTIDAPFAVGRYEVTRGEFARFVQATGYDAGTTCGVWNEEEDKVEARAGVGWRNPGFSQTDRHPVTCMNWHDAQAYVQWVSRETGKPYRLLSEAEWEYVARGGTRAEYWSGKTASHDYANYGADQCCKGLATGADQWVYTAPVGSFAANALGVFDTAGNVWEWVEDCWYGDYFGAPRDGRAWTSGYCRGRVLRGGSWSLNPESVSSASRGGWEPGDRNNYFGFRMARTLTQ